MVWIKIIISVCIMLLMVINITVLIFCIMVKIEMCKVISRSVAQSIEAGAANRAWMAQNYDDIRGWLRKQNKAARAA